jgi:hypothetical protein
MTKEIMDSANIVWEIKLRGQRNLLRPFPESFANTLQRGVKAKVEKARTGRWTPGIGA